jgi:lysyl-tRNA synthetase class II
MEEPTNLYEAERRQKLQKLRELGVDPYGGRTEGVTPLGSIKGTYSPEMGHDGGPVLKGAGRVMLKRDMGKLSFLTLRDESGDLQVAIDKRRVDETSWEIRSLLDLGDLIVVQGPLGVTNKGETTIWATKVEMAAKALLPPPAKWEGLSDVELRYRQRYVDLWANPEVMKQLRLRMQTVAEIRKYMADRGYIEVETPMMQPLAGGAAARPFVTHHRALDIPLYLRIAPELYLKRLLVGGFTKIFELNRNFRNEGISPRHNPEFTMLEAYEAFGSWETMADLVEGMVCHLAETLFGGLTIEHLRTDLNGLHAANAYTSSDPEALDAVCRARLDLVSEVGQGELLRTPPSANEKWAVETGSEGYERGQAGFDALIREIEAELLGKSDGDRRRHLVSKFRVITRIIKLQRPWPRVKMADLVEEWTERMLGTPWRFDKRSILDAAPEAYLRLVLRRFTAHGTQWVEQYKAGLLRYVERALADPEMRFLFEKSLSQSAATDDALIEANALLQGLEDAGMSRKAVDSIRSDPGYTKFVAEVVLTNTQIGHLSPAEQLVRIYEKYVEPTLISPCFVTHVPSVIIPLARKSKDDPFFADVYELAINGQEISPGYSELNDPDVQAANFAQQVGDKEEQQKTDEDFLTALRYGMPPAGGMGLGIDRLVMMLTGAESIRDVILFPLMKPT